MRFGLLAALIQPAVTPALADYLLRPGDVVEISVSGAPDFHRRTMISDDGKVSFPLLGEIGAADLAVSQLRARVRDGLAARKAFDNPDVTVEIVEYRPVYVSGDVAKPGAVPYRPGMRVRDAVAVAGGLDVMQLRGRDVLVQAVEARGEYEKLLIESDASRRSHRAASGRRSPAAPISTSPTCEPPRPRPGCWTNWSESKPSS